MSPDGNRPVILLTGRPGIGKTTVIKAIISLIRGNAGGFYTREIRTRSRRTGFEIVTLGGQTAWLASRASAPVFKDEVPLGKYRVNLRAIDSTAVPALRRAQKTDRIIIIDEIGPMEIVSTLFCQTVLEILDGEALVIGTIVQRPHPFADRVRAHPRVRIITVTIENRAQLPPQVVAELARS